MTNKQIKGMSLIEILVVITVFALLGILTTRAVILTLQGGKKSESQIKVRENIDYSLGVIERQLRNANSVPDCESGTSGIINYIDQYGNQASFSCVGLGSGDGYIASGSARLTADSVNVTACSFVCSLGESANPVSVKIDVSAKDANISGAQGAQVTAETEIFLRNY